MPLLAVTFAAFMRTDDLHQRITRHLVACIGLWVLLAAPVVGQDVGRLIAQGDSLLAMEKAAKALEYYEKAVKEERSARTYLARARAYYTLDRMDRFLLDIDQALRLDSTSGEAHYQRALYALRANDLARTEHHATKAIQYAPAGALQNKAYILRGEARADMKRPTQALADLEKGLASGLVDTEAMRTLARLYDGAGRHADALTLLVRLCELEPSNVGHWSNSGFELIMLDRYDEAMTMIEKALSIDRDEPVALSNRAYIHYKQGREKEAWSDVERSLKAFPANAYALRTRALLWLNKGEREKACEDLTLAKVLADIAEVDQLMKEHCSSTPSRKR